MASAPQNLASYLVELQQNVIMNFMLIANNIYKPKEFTTIISSKLPY